MLELYLRPFYQKYFADLVASYFLTRVNPTWLTFCSLWSGILCAALIAIGEPILAIFMLILSGFFDTMDGTVARLSVRSSESGAMLDILFDRIVEFSIVLGLFLYDPSRAFLTLVMMGAFLTLVMMGAILTCVTSFLIVGIFTSNDTSKSFYYSRGLIERPEAFIFFGAMILLPQFFNFLCVTFVSLVFLTSFIRVKQFLEQMKNHGT